MNAGYCRLTAVPMRAEASHRSEMVSQLLHGECCRVLETTAEWVRVAAYHDLYEGWVQRVQLEEISDAELQAYLEAPKARLAVPFITQDQQFPHILTMGAMIPLSPSTFPFTESIKEVSMPCWVSVERARTMSAEAKAEQLRESALPMVGTPYLWGGRTPLGIDCSGFTQLLYSLVGIQLPRDASQQVQIGDPVDFIHESRLGDLAFFHNEEGRVVHVGMMLNEHEIIHSSGRVRVDRIDENGIFNTDLQRYTHNLRVVKRIIC